MLMPDSHQRRAYPVTIVDLATFVVAADAPDLRTAAAQADVTPSALLRRLHKLEDRVDVRLFEPEPAAGLHLTDSGRRMEPLARDALARLQDLERFVHAEHTHTTLETR